MNVDASSDRRDRTRPSGITGLGWALRTRVSGVLGSGDVTHAPPWQRAVVAVLAVPALIVLRYAITPLVGTTVEYITLFPVTVAVALFAGMWPAVLTGILGSIAADFFFMQPLYRFEVDSEAFFRITIVTLTSVFFGYVGEVLRAARSKAEQQSVQLQASEERLAFALETSSTGAWDLDLSDRTAQRSLEHDRIFGYETLLPKWTYEIFLDHIVPSDRAFVDERFREAVANGTDWSFECRIRRVDGDVRWIWAAGRARPVGPGGARRMSGIVQDITARKRSQEELERLNEELQDRVAEQTLEIRRGYDMMKAERQRFYDVLETLPVYVALLTEEHRFAFANRSFRERFGEIPDLPCHELLFGRGEPCDGCETYKVMTTGAPHRWEWTGPDGREYDVYDFPFTDTDGSPLIMEMGIDVTSVKRAEAALRLAKETLERRVEERTAEVAERERRLQRTSELLEAITEGTDELIVALDGSFRYVYFNNVFKNEMRRLTGKSIEIGQSMIDVLADTPERQSVDMELWRRAIGGETIRETLRYGDTGGRRRTYSARLAPIRDARGEIIGAGQTATDVTGQVEAEEEHRQTRDYLENLFNHANAPIIVWDPQFRIIRFNRAFERLTGRSAADVLGRHLELLFPRERREGALAHIRRAVAGERWEVVEITIAHMDGSVRTLLWNSAPLYAADGTTILATIAQGQDITERIEAETALRQARDELEHRVKERTAELDLTVEALMTSSRQLRALASELTLAEQRERQRLAMVLHDHLQQLLVAALIQSVPLQRSDEPKVSEVAIELSELVRESLDTCRSLTAELSPPILQHGGLIGALRWLSDWMLEKHKLAIELRLEDEAAPQDEVVATVLFQAVRELLFNVVKHAQVRTAQVDARRLDGQIEITVRDEGAGFDPSRVLHGDTGSGMGLAKARERLEFIGGHMDVDSAPGRGSLFTLSVPLEEAGPREPAATGAPL